MLIGSDSAQVGLVVVFPDAVKGLWAPEINAFVDAVSERLEHGFVTYAVANGKPPTVADALAAARFAGCRSAVVVSTVETVPESWLGGVAVPALITGARRDPDAVVGAFLASTWTHETAA